MIDVCNISIASRVEEGEPVKQFYIHNPDDFKSRDKDGNIIKDEGIIASIGLDNPKVFFPALALFVGLPLVESGVRSQF